MSDEQKLDVLRELCGDTLIEELVVQAKRYGCGNYHYSIGALKVRLGLWCSTMNKPRSDCGCPDCGSTLIDFDED